MHPAGPRGRRFARGAMVVGNRGAQGMRHALRDRDRRLRARAGGFARRPWAHSQRLGKRLRIEALITALAVSDDESLTLDDLQRQVLLPQIALFSQANPDPQAQADYVALAAAVRDLEVPAALI